jgi:hypothetical protein
MRLTSDYRRVIGLFNTPLQEEIEYGEYGESARTDFEVGPFVYAINFSPEDDRGRTVNVEFELVDIDVTGEELVRMMSKFKKSIAKEKGIQEQEESKQTMSLAEAKTLERQILNQHSHAELEITGPYVIKIFSTVISIIKDYVKKHRTNCIVFSAASEDRSRVYQRMMKSAFPGAGIRVGPSPWGAGTEIRVCFI